MGMALGYILAAVLLGVVVFILAAPRLRGGGDVASVTPEQPGLDESATDAPDTTESDALEQKAESLDNMRLVIHGLLQNMSETTDTMMSGSSAYDASLSNHAESITKATDAGDIKAIEKALLSELAQMREATAAYRQELDKANATIQRQQQSLEKLQEDAGTDFLTQVPNRQQLDQRLSEEFERFKRYERPFSVLMLDVDHFKNVNDTYGHLAGDRILRAVAQTTREQKRMNDFVGRYGGEEFMLILPETTAEQARAAAEKIRTALAQAKFRFKGQALSITASLGAAQVGETDETKEMLVSRVDAALYRAKENGRNRTELAG